MRVRPSSRTALAGAVLLVALAGCSSAASPSVAPSSAASPGASAKASPAASPLPMSVKSISRSVKAGDHAGITVATADGAECSIVVTYPSGPATASGLEPQIAASNGYVAWGWTVDASVPAGTVPIDVTCTKGEASGQLHTELTVK